MPRSNRPRGARGPDDDDAFDITRVFAGRHRTETRRGVLWNVQSISPASAQKSYVCPGCGLEIAPGTGHLVTWRGDGLMGEADDLAARRHWHVHCWKIS